MVAREKLPPHDEVVAPELEYEDDPEDESPKGVAGQSDIFVALKKASKIIEDDERLGKGTSTRPPVTELRAPSVHDIWLLRAWFLVERGEYVVARDLLQLAYQHARETGVVEVLGRIRVQQAKLALLSFDGPKTIRYVQAAAQKGGDVRLWRDIWQVMTQAYLLPHSLPGPSGASIAHTYGTEALLFLDKGRCSWSDCGGHGVPTSRGT